MTDLMNEVEKIAVETAAAVAFGSHFAKGNASGKENMDRISGSGVFARDPDSIITMTAHEEPNAFTIEMTLRNFPMQGPCRCFSFEVILDERLGGDSYSRHRYMDIQELKSEVDKYREEKKGHVCTWGKNGPVGMQLMPWLKPLKRSSNA